MLNKENLIAMQSKVSPCSVDVIRAETSTVFVRMPVDNLMFTSQPTLPPWLNASCCERGNGSDLTTGLNCACLLRKHEECLHTGGGTKSAPVSFMTFVQHWNISIWKGKLWIIFKGEGFFNVAANHALLQKDVRHETDFYSMTTTTAPWPLMEIHHTRVKPRLTIPLHSSGGRNSSSFLKVISRWKCNVWTSQIK